MEDDDGDKFGHAPIRPTWRNHSGWRDTGVAVSLVNIFLWFSTNSNSKVFKRKNAIIL